MKLKIEQNSYYCPLYLYSTPLCWSKLSKPSLFFLWLFPHQQWELSTKLVLNAVSTGAHVLKGKVYQNHMIDVQVTNSKLYRRASRLLQVRQETINETIINKKVNTCSCGLILFMAPDLYCPLALFKYL